MKSLMLRCRCLAAVLAAFCECACLTESHADDAKQALPLKRVVMLNSGVGYFEHSGQIEGSRLVEFPVKVDDINDLLKSLIVQDRGAAE